MRALEGKVITRKKTELLIVEPSQLLFKVVVNNYKQQEQTLENIEETGETMMDEHQGLPPQPTGYLKFPDYDWF